MNLSCQYNPWLINGFTFAYQIVFNFAFLTIFFFVYVVKVEKQEFEDQMNYIVDSILTDEVKSNFFALYPNTNKENLVSIIGGTIDQLKFDSERKEQSSISKVNKENSKIQRKSFMILLISVIVLIISTVILLLIGYCLPVYKQSVEALWVVLFVGITELTFLQLITKKYKSADPNKVKRSLALAISNWIKNNQKIKPKT